jgi:hypothetical protein
MTGNARKFCSDGVFGASHSSLTKKEEKQREEGESESLDELQVLSCLH